MKTSDYENSSGRKPRRTDGFTVLLGIGCVFCVCLACVTLVCGRDADFSAYNESYQYSQWLEHNAPGQQLYASASDNSVSRESSEIPMMAEETYVVYMMPVSASAVMASSTPAGAAKNVMSGAEYDDRIEREARGVIRGEYGNDPGREKALGSDYAAVQQRVNAILD